MVIFHLEDCVHSQGEPPPSRCLRNPWTTFYIPFFSLAALKKVFSEHNEIQRIIDEDLVVLNLVVSQNRAGTLGLSLELSQ